MTGYVDHAALAGAGKAEIIGKPFTITDLADEVACALAHPGRHQCVIRLRG